VNKRSATIIILLALLTLVGFILVSHLMGAKPSESASSPATATQTAAAHKPNASLSPFPPVGYNPSQAAGQMSADLARAQELLSQITAAVATNDWAQAQELFDEFERRTQRLPAPQLHHPDISPVLQDFFDLYDVQLERAIAEQNARQAGFAINQLYGIVGEQRARFGARGVPLEFQRLRFLVREVGLWSEAGDEQMLRVRAIALRDAWRQDVRPIIIARRGGIQPAKNFDQLVQRLSAAEQMPELTALIPEFNKELDQMDGLFHRLPRPPSAAGGPGRPADEEE
jgi:hypothetical protein